MELRKKLIPVLTKCGFLLCITAGLFASGQSTISPEKALDKLKQGNIRFQTGKRLYPNLSATRRTTTAVKGQHPYAAIIGCSDSRAPLEHIFDAGIGDIFAVRVAGNIAGASEIGSIEYAISHLGAPVVIVLGHTSCGAVTAAVKGGAVDANIIPIMRNIEPAVRKAEVVYGSLYSQQLLDEAIKINVYQTMEDLLKKSDMLAELVKAHKIKLIGAIYHLDDGKMQWLGEHPMQEAVASGEHGSEETEITSEEHESHEVASDQHEKPKQQVMKGNKHTVAHESPVRETVSHDEMMKTHSGEGSVKFYFSGRKLGATPRKPIYVTLKVEAPEGAKSFSLRMTAENRKTGAETLFFALPKVMVIDGHAQVQFYWSAKKFKAGYVPKGHYVLNAKLDFKNAGGSVIKRMTVTPQPLAQYTIVVQ